MSSLIEETAPPKFYPAKIDHQHHQLKHRISSKHSDTIYYCSGQEIYALHLETQTRELIRSLPWAPVCLDAAHGWVCVGGWERGRCAFIEVDRNPAACTRSGQRAEVDDLLPLDLCRESRIHPNQGSRATSALNDTSKYEMHIHNIGASIVNAVSIVNLRVHQDGSRDEICAIVSNNDQSVQIFSMTHMKVIHHIQYPIPMNHASISPDGQLLIAVGDGPEVFFHRGRAFDKALNTVVEGCVYCPWDTSEGQQDEISSTVRNDTPHQREDVQSEILTYWRFLADSRLPNTSADDACFSTSFSSSGKLCAVASQGGLAAIYDVNLIAKGVKPNEAIIKSFRSSKPHVSCDGTGAFRSMSFSPAPWDLLVCAEDQGRIVVLDLRSLGTTIQTIELSTVSDKVDVTDMKVSVTSEEHEQADPYRRSWQSHLQALQRRNERVNGVTSMADHVDYAANRRRVEQAAYRGTTQAIRDHSDGLTESELRMIDTIGLRRYPPGHNAPSLVNHPVDLSSQRGVADLIDPLDLPLSSLLANRSSANQRSPAEGQIQGRPRSSPQRVPQRRNSVVIARSALDSDQRSSVIPDSATLGTATLEPRSRNSRLSLSGPDSEIDMFSHRAAPSPSLALDAWQTITNAMTADRLDDTGVRHNAETAVARRTSEGGSDNHDAGVFTPDQTTQSLLDRNDRQRNQMGMNLARLRQIHAAMAAGGRTGEVLAGLDDLQHLGESILDRPYQGRNGVVVMGVGWSNDGRHLFIGTEDGVLEYPVNIRNRMQWPAEQIV